LTSGIVVVAVVIAVVLVEVTVVVVWIVEVEVEDVEIEVEEDAGIDVEEIFIEVVVGVVDVEDIDVEDVEVIFTALLKIAVNTELPVNEIIALGEIEFEIVALLACHAENTKLPEFTALMV
jgi:hypothetical protein